MPSLKSGSFSLVSLCFSPLSLSSLPAITKIHQVEGERISFALWGEKEEREPPPVAMWQQCLSLSSSSQTKVLLLHSCGIGREGTWNWVREKLQGDGS